MIGTRRNPGLVLTFKGRDNLPRGVKVKQVRRPGLVGFTGAPTMLDWVRRLPGRTWDPDRNSWIATALGPDPDGELARLEFSVDLSRAARAGITSLADLIEPWVELATDVPDRLEVAVGLDETSTVIWPRMTGYEECVKSVPAAARWIKSPGCWIAKTADMAGVTGLPVPGSVRELAKTLDAERTSGGTNAATSALSADLARAIHIDDVRGSANRLIGAIGDVPDWFGQWDLFGYQAAGSLAVASGHNFLVDEPGLGKGSPLWEKILTPTGWTTFGEIAVGDNVVGSDGKPCRVTGVFPRGLLDTYKVTMSDGSSVVVDGDHLWDIESKGAKFRHQHGRVVSTLEIKAELERDGALVHGARVHWIPMVEPVQFARQGPPLIDPYIMGALLGDGHFGSMPYFSSEDPEIVELMRVKLPEGVALRAHAVKAGKCPVYGFSGRSGGWRSIMNDTLAELGLKGTRSHTKFVPECYLLAPPEQRLDMLRGLFDTDGHAGAALEYVTVSPRLAEDVAFLVRSLGGVTRTATKQPRYINRDGEKVEGKLAYRVIVTMPPHLNPFLLTRKAQAWNAPWRCGPSRAISTIEPAEREQVVCIQVSAPDQLYVTTDFIVTHNTVQALAAAAIHQSQRVVVICPPVVNTNWAREAGGSHLVEHMPDAETRPVLTAVPDLPAAGKRKKKAPKPAPEFVPGGRIVRIVSGRKEPELPKTGMVIVSDSLLAARPALLERICRWSPDAVLVDEVHRAKTFESARATASRTVAATVGSGLRVAITGTPVFASPADLAAALAISGHLDTVFGGLSRFLETYCVQNFFQAWVAREEMMPQLLEMLEAHVWTRRTKADVLPDLPKKFRSGVFLDVDLASFRAAHADVEAKVDEWLDQFEAGARRMPTAPGQYTDPSQAAGSGQSEVEIWARGSVGLISPLRRAAGLAKVEAATDRIREHVEATTDDSGREPVYTRPLIVWVHHREVGDAMAVAVPAVVARTEIIRGGTSADNRGRIVDDFQAGKIPVLVASISAAGVGITLTGSADMTFVETDWTVSNVTQAEDRACRIGQTRPVMITTLIAEGTLDERIQGVLQTKSVLLDQLLPGGDNAPAISGIDGDKATTPAAIITDIAVKLIASRAKGSRKRAA